MAPVVVVSAAVASRSLRVRPSITPVVPAPPSTTRTVAPIPRRQRGRDHHVRNHHGARRDPGGGGVKGIGAGGAGANGATDPTFAPLPLFQAPTAGVYQGPGGDGAGSFYKEFTDSGGNLQQIGQAGAGGAMNPNNGQQGGNGGNGGLGCGGGGAGAGDNNGGGPAAGSGGAGFVYITWGLE